MLLFACVVFARATSVTLPDLVRKSSVIVRGYKTNDYKAASNAPAKWVYFKILETIRGSTSLKSTVVALCNSPPPMTDYDDLSRLSGETILFLYPKSEGCFELTHTYRSIVYILNDKVSASIEGVPEESSSAFIHRVRSLISKTPATDAAKH
jgi:hypothetical protein